ncbi:hypothetical protein PoB_000989500 [Plakobranchus ocellatus]|uniref:Uncharacterized protein n=1 Tax=Plakobranchus ocellatus TaxID=259542 RepID=A0AAV3YJX8_9GAST|nr:hypothetical protein PoB_000989500 [Plakobranchus ocellatus]
MKVNAEKTKLKTNNIRVIISDIRIDGSKPETVQNFKHLGPEVKDEGSKQENIVLEDHRWQNNKTTYILLTLLVPLRRETKNSPSKTI